MGKLTHKVALVLLTILFFFSTSVAPALAAITYLFDANGNMTSDGTKCYEYNQENQLVKVKTCSNSQTIAEYVYDYQGQRLVKKTYTNGVLQKTTYAPSDSYETVKLASGTTQNTSYYYANDELIAKKNPDGSKNYIHNDHLGSTTVQTNQTGTVVESTQYDPWGEVLVGGTKNKFQYTGQEKDSETGLNYYNARYYDPHSRHFTQADDIIQDPFNPQTLNRYSYVQNNPVNYKDPTGHYIETALDIAFLAIDLNDIRNDPRNLWNWAALGGDVAGTALPFVTGVGLGIKLIEHGGDIAKTVEHSRAVAKTIDSTRELKMGEKFVPNSSITSKYTRPSGATTKAQREFVQGKPCVTCGILGDPMVADHKLPLVKEYYSTGKINTNNMKSIKAVQPQCMGCSQKQGGLLSNFSKTIKKALKLK